LLVSAISTEPPQPLDWATITPILIRQLVLSYFYSHRLQRKVFTARSKYSVKRSAYFN
jgi:hypothetical protein